MAKNNTNQMAVTAESTTPYAPPLHNNESDESPARPGLQVVISYATASALGSAVALYLEFATRPWNEPGFAILVVYVATTSIPCAITTKKLSRCGFRRLSITAFLFVYWVLGYVGFYALTVVLPSSGRPHLNGAIHMVIFPLVLHVYTFLLYGQEQNTKQTHPETESPNNLMQLPSSAQRQEATVGPRRTSKDR